MSIAIALIAVALDALTTYFALRLGAVERNRLPRFLMGKLGMAWGLAVNHGLAAVLVLLLVKSDLGLGLVAGLFLSAVIQNIKTIHILRTKP